jgi:hypothetical protein
LVVDAGGQNHLKHLRRYKRISNVGLLWPPAQAECESADTTMKPTNNHTRSDTKMKDKNEEFLLFLDDSMIYLRLFI